MNYILILALIILPLKNIAGQSTDLLPKNTLSFAFASENIVSNGTVGYMVGYTRSYKVVKRTYFNPRIRLYNSSYNMYERFIENDDSSFLQFPDEYYRSINTDFLLWLVPKRKKRIMPSISIGPSITVFTYKYNIRTDINSCDVLGLCPDGLWLESTDILLGIVSEFDISILLNKTTHTLGLHTALFGENGSIGGIQYKVGF